MWVLLYNFLAFSSQAITGGVVELTAERCGTGPKLFRLLRRKSDTYLLFAAAGAILAIFSALIPFGIVMSILIAGIGNSLFHVGGGRGGFIASADREDFVLEYPSRLFGIAPTSKKEWGFGDVAWERTSFAKREEAKEFVGTAAALWGITAGVYLASMGPKGMQELSTGLMQRSCYLAQKISALPGVKLPFRNGICFKEFVVNFDGTNKKTAQINKVLLDRGIFGGHDLSGDFPQLGQSALYSVTEGHTQADLDQLVSALSQILV